MLVSAKSVTTALQLFAGALTLTSCSVLFTWDDWGKTGSFEGEIRGDTLHRPDSETCEPVKICFFDEDGNPIGGDVLEPGSEIPIPPGTKSAKAKPLEDPQDRSSGPGHLARFSPWHLRKFAIDPDLVRGVSEYSITVWSRTLDEAEATADAIELALTMGTEPPAGVYEIDYATYSVLRGGRVAFFFADDRAFSRLDVTLNGDLVSTLDEMQVQAQPGLHVAAFELPLSSFHAGVAPGVTYTNSYAFEAENGADPRTRAGKRATFRYTP